FWLTSWVLIAGMAGCSGDDDQIDPAVRLEQDVAIIDQYLEDNNIDAIIDDSGLRLVIQDVGLGRPLEEADLIYVTFEGRLLSDGSLFDQQEDWFPIDTEQIPILGWAIGLDYITEGGSVTLYIPSGLAFGSRSGNGLPSNSNVIYEITVYDSEESIAEDALEIDEFLAENGLTAEVDPESDIRYIITEEGTGASPTNSSTVVINYEGRFLGGDVFDSGVGAVFDLEGLIRGWQIGLPFAKEGGSITLYIPAFYAYGPLGRPPTIPGESILVFEIELDAVI
ncbi:MAG: FKBP-type peptidyl-prolyl cis-trans isomerase, partial [Bacteroidota bacterium]